MKKVAIGCQGGGMHAAFEVGVLTEILKNIEGQKRQTDIAEKKRFDLVGLSGTSAGALCALMVWYGLAPKNGRPGSEDEACRKLNDFWNEFVARTGAETVLNLLTYGALRAEETEIPVLGVNAPIFGLNPYGAIFKAVAGWLPSLGVREGYFDLDKLLAEACPALTDETTINWDSVTTRLLLGASEVIDGVETVFDSDCCKKHRGQRTQPTVTHRWRKRLPLSLPGVAASGSLPAFREAEHIDSGYYWDGLYSQNPPVREFIAGPPKDEMPDELWIVRINPQQGVELPRTNAKIQRRQNQLTGNLSLNKELDFILTVNEWRKNDQYGDFAIDHKEVTVRTIKIKKETAAQLQYASKFNRSHDFVKWLRDEGHKVAQDWLDRWPMPDCYPDDAAY